jgi:endonuclease III related protein
LKNKRLLSIYRLLLEQYGPQHWWPGGSSFEVMVGAILTQSTAWRNVEKAIANLKNAHVMSPSAIRLLTVDELAVLIRPSGYYNAKARKLKALGDWCGDDLNKLFAHNTDTLRHQLLQVHGVGPETADSILLYAADKPVFVIDAYTRRIIGRVGIAPDIDSYDAYQSLFMNNLPADTSLFNEYHALLVRLGKEVCRKVPACRECCLFAAHQCNGVY